MNICLTTECNNHCPFCFLKELHCHEQTQFMSIQNLEKILNWAKDDTINWKLGISLLGGEPTLYPYIEEALNMLINKFKFPNVSIITNLLCNLPTIQILNNYESLRYLVNTCYDNNKEELFYRNLDLLVRNCNNNLLTLSTTLTNNDKLNLIYINRLVEITNKFPSIKKIRLGIAEPSIDDVWDDIKNFDEEVLQIYDLFPDISINFDCAVNKCLVSDKVVYLLLDKGVQLHRICLGPPMDIMPDLSARYCFSSNKCFTVENILHFKSRKILENYLIQLGYDNYVVKNKKCINCKEYLTRKCLPCHCIDNALILGEQMI